MNVPAAAATTPSARHTEPSLVAASTASRSPRPSHTVPLGQVIGPTVPLASLVPSSALGRLSSTIVTRASAAPSPIVTSSTPFKT